MGAAVMSRVDERNVARERFEVQITGGERASMVRVTGPLDIQHTPRFLEKVLPLCRGGRRLVVDLNGADYADSSGIRGLMELEERLTAEQGELRLVVRSGSRVERVIDLLKLRERLNVCHSSAEAWSEKMAA